VRTLLLFVVTHAVTVYCFTDLLMHKITRWDSHNETVSNLRNETKFYTWWHETKFRYFLCFAKQAKFRKTTFWFRSASYSRNKKMLNWKPYYSITSPTSDKPYNSLFYLAVISLTWPNSGFRLGTYWYLGKSDSCSTGQPLEPGTLLLMLLKRLIEISRPRQ
jgi:hypothetical protein